MNDKKPLILISNDDGVRAKGLAALVDALSPLGDILVMAPDRARSGSACGITPHDPVRYKVVEERRGVKICACTGRPVDCVKLALDVVADRRPALVVSGVNHGDNSSVSVHYSGTMGVLRWAFLCATLMPMPIFRLRLFMCGTFPSGSCAKGCHTECA